MNETDPGRKRRFAIAAAVLLLLGGLAYFQAFAASRTKPPSAESTELSDNEQLDPAVCEFLSGPFESSFEMRENVDFLLTPALLMQEYIDPDVVVTYPNE